MFIHQSNTFTVLLCQCNCVINSLQAKNDTLNILCDVLTPETECSDVLSNSISLDHSTNTPLEDSLTLTIDIYRHKEVSLLIVIAIVLLRELRFHCILE